MLATLTSLNPWLIGILLNTVLLAIAWVIPKPLLTQAGVLHAWALGILIWGTLSWQGYLIVMVYFLVGSAVTRIGMAQKEAAGIAEKRSGARGPENVWGSALTGTLCAVGVFFLDEPYRSFFLLGFVASFATKLSDTTASEVGKAYGKRTFLITTLQPVSPGTEGAVSLEGTLAGAVASAAIAFLGWGVSFIDLTGVLFCVLAAFIATNLESVIGATWQSQVEWMTNEVVNFINTLIGAIAAILFVVIWHSIMGIPTV